MGRKREGVVIFLCALLVACGTTTSQFTYEAGLQVDQPVKDPGCYDASVLLGADLARSRSVAKSVLAAFDATVEKETETRIQAQRKSHFGLFVGSGGEVLIVNLAEAPNGNTFVTVTTKTGFVGAAGQRAWSCEIVDKLVQMAKN